MELKLGSVMLLLSCSLQQSLWGILASVPQTTANKCKNKISSEGAPTQRVQMIRRIPARCSGWDEAWSWISNKDCRTKYILDYVELPSAVQKVDQKDCEEEVAAKTETGDFNLADERYLAIAFGSATVALLILIVIIVISVLRRGNGCRVCSSRPGYSFANASEREHLDASNTAHNDYVDDELKHTEPMYEEIHDRTNAKKKLDFNEDIKPPNHQNNSQGGDCCDMNGTKTFPSEGVHRRPVTPSAPYEEELQKTSCKSVPNEYSVFGESTQQCPQQRSGNSDNLEKNCDNLITSENANEEEFDKDIKKDEDLKPEREESDELAKDNKVVNNTELPSNSNKTIDRSTVSSSAEVEEKISHKSAHSYENLNKTGSSVEDYEPLTYDDRDLCFNTSSNVSDANEATVKCLNEENV